MTVRKAAAQSSRESSATTTPAPTYTFTPLTASGFSGVQALFMTREGRVIGRWNNPSGITDIFLYDPSSGMHDLALPGSVGCRFTLGTPGTLDQNINASGDVIGKCELPAVGNVHGFVYNSTGLHDLTFTGVPPSCTRSETNRINNAGQVLGFSCTSKGESHDYLYTPDASGGTMIDLVTTLNAFGYTSVAFTTPVGTGYSLNDSGQVIGEALNASGHDVAVRYNSKTNTVTELGSLSPLSDATPRGINSSGSVTGVAGAGTIPHHPHAFLYVDPGPMQDLGTLGGDRSEGQWIADSGQVVGVSDYDVAGDQYVFLYDSGGMHALALGGTSSFVGCDFGYTRPVTKMGVAIATAYILPGNGTYHTVTYDSNGLHEISFSPTGKSNCAMSNDAGQIAGSAVDSNGNSLGYLASGGVITPLTFGFVSPSDGGTSVNNSGQVVGNVRTAAGGVGHGFLYGNGVMYDLNDLVQGKISGDVITNAEGVFPGPTTGISDAGMILASGRLGGVNGFFVLSPTLTVTPTTLNFGGVGVGSTKDRTFTVTNSGSGTLTGRVTTSSPFSIVSGSPFRLTAKAKWKVTVRFSPTSTGDFLGNARVSSNRGSASVSLRGKGK